MDLPVNAIGGETQAEMTMLLGRLALFAPLPLAQLQYLAGRTRMRRLARGEFLFQKGDSAKWLFAVVDGHLKLAIQSPEGQEKVVTVAGPAETFGEAAILLDASRQVNAEALGDARVLCITSDAIRLLADQDLAFFRRLAARVAGQVMFLLGKLETYAVRSGSQRVIAYLLGLCPREAGDGSVHIDLPVQKGVIASALNLTPESLSRVLHDLAKAGVIDRAGKRITINSVSRLRALSTAAGGAALPLSGNAKRGRQDRLPP